MLNKLIQWLITIASALLGSVLFFIVMLYDIIASPVNTIKTKWGFQKLTDFRKSEEQLLYIPLAQDQQSALNITLSPSCSTSDGISFVIPEQLAGNAVSLLLGFRYEFQERSDAFEIELNLSDGRNNTETIFLFVNPFMVQPGVQYNEATLWYPMPPGKQFSIRCIDVQPPDRPFHIHNIQVCVKATR